MSVKVTSERSGLLEASVAKFVHDSGLTNLQTVIVGLLRGECNLAYWCENCNVVTAPDAQECCQCGRALTKGMFGIAAATRANHVEDTTGTDGEQ